LGLLTTVKPLALLGRYDLHTGLEQELGIELSSTIFLEKENLSEITEFIFENYKEECKQFFFSKILIN